MPFPFIPSDLNVNCSNSIDLFAQDNLMEFIDMHDTVAHVNVAKKNEPSRPFTQITQKDLTFVSHQTSETPSPNNIEHANTIKSTYNNQLLQKYAVFCLYPKYLSTFFVALADSDSPVSFNNIIKYAYFGRNEPPLFSSFVRQNAHLLLQNDELSNFANLDPAHIRFIQELDKERVLLPFVKQLETDKSSRKKFGHAVEIFRLEQSLSNKVIIEMSKKYIPQLQQMNEDLESKYLPSTEDDLSPDVPRKPSFKIPTENSSVSNFPPLSRPRLRNGSLPKSFDEFEKCEFVIERPFVRSIILPQETFNHVPTYDYSKRNDLVLEVNSSAQPSPSLDFSTDLSEHDSVFSEQVELDEHVPQKFIFLSNSDRIYSSSFENLQLSEKGTVNFSDNLWRIGKSAFKCAKINDVHFNFTQASQLQEIGSHAFENANFKVKNGILDLSQCAYLDRIGSYAFSQNNNIQVVILPDSLFEPTSFADLDGKFHPAYHSISSTAFGNLDSKYIITQSELDSLFPYGYKKLSAQEITSKIDLRCKETQQTCTAPKVNKYQEYIYTGKNDASLCSALVKTAKSIFKNQPIPDVASCFCDEKISKQVFEHLDNMMKLEAAKPTLNRVPVTPCQIAKQLKDDLTLSRNFSSLASFKRVSDSTPSKACRSNNSSPFPLLPAKDSNFQKIL